MNATKAALALVNARWRSGPRFEHAHSGTLLIGNGRVLALGEHLTAAAERTIDVEGALVVPGFVDTHTHLGWAGQGLWQVNWSNAACRADALARARLAAQRIEPGLWLFGGGWSRRMLPDAELPTLHELDVATGNTPLFVTSTDGSLTLVNTRAIQLLRLTNRADSTFPPGGDLELDQHGELSGRLRGAAVHTRATAGALPPADRYRKRAELRAALRELAHHGITEAHDIATLPDHGPTPLTHRERSFTDATLFDDLAERDDLTARISIRPHLDRWPEAADWARERHNARVQCDGVKLLLDRELYSPPGSGGGYTYRYPGFNTAREWVRGAHSAGLNVTIHAVGDWAVHEALDLFEQATAGAPAARHRIAHARRIAPEDIPRFARLGIIAEMQPCDMVEQLPRLRDRFPEPFLTTAYPFAALRAAGARLLFGSDWRLDQRADLSDLDPLRGILAATTCAVPGQAISVGDALACYTYQREFEVGGPADLTVLSRDLVADGAAALEDARVLLTIVDGQVVYERA